MPRLPPARPPLTCQMIPSSLGLIAGGEETRATVLGGATIGLLFGAMAGYGLYAGLLRIPARLFFSVTSGFILLLAAAMSSQAARFLVQADLLSRNYASASGVWRPR